MAVTVLAMWVAWLGPALDRAGFRLNDTWVYRWIRYPQANKKAHADAES